MSVRVPSEAPFGAVLRGLWRPSQGLGGCARAISGVLFVGHLGDSKATNLAYWNCATAHMRFNDLCYCMPAPQGFQDGARGTRDVPGTSPLGPSRDRRQIRIPSHATKVSRRVTRQTPRAPRNAQQLWESRSCALEAVFATFPAEKSRGPGDHFFVALEHSGGSGGIHPKSSSSFGHSV